MSHQVHNHDLDPGCRELHIGGMVYGECQIGYANREEGFGQHTDEENRMANPENIKLVTPTLEAWWVEQARLEAPEIARKAHEYGSNSLAAMGAMLGSMANGEAPTGNQTYLVEADQLELGCFAYAYGKLQRALDAYQRGERPSQDTWVDIAVYAKMVLRIRDAGGWPGDVGV